MADHLEAVRKYASDANEEIVGKIEKHLGIALRSRDGSLVSCSDQSELDRVRESWCKKKARRRRRCGVRRDYRKSV